MLEGSASLPTKRKTLIISYYPPSENERYQVYSPRKARHSQKAIAELLERHPSPSDESYNAIMVFEDIALGKHISLRI
ncbi:hypothetical protein [Microbulbifer variabilis]|uniref:hypothetical protein n=1 Tax=Microbulbifer variabilis TaxID=266805 RepID=UPI001CFEC7B8|nr:hypothetical protein [Microbulbifer variabilis]